MADNLSHITTHLGPEAVQSILDGVTLGATHRAKGCDPAVVEDDHNTEKEVCVTAGWVLVEMHMTDWAKAQREHPVLNAVLNWLEAQTRLVWRDSWLSMPLARRANWYGGIVRILWLSRTPSTYTQFPRVKMKIYYSLWCWRCIGLLLWMGVIKTQDIKAVTIPYPYYKNAFGGQGWPTRCDNLLGSAHTAYSMRATSPRPLYIPSWLLLPWISCMLTLPALRPHWSKTSHLELLTSWYSKTISQSMCWRMWPLTKLQKLLLNFYTMVTSLSLGTQPGCWVIEVLTSWVTWLRKCARSLA